MTTRTARARLAPIDLPDFGMPDASPELPPSLYGTRLAALRARAAERGYDRLVVYADREHSANLAWLTGFDPRFEEAVLIVGPAGDPAILVGNECYGMAGAAPLAMRRHRFQDLSLPGQPRDRSRPLAEILGEEGIGQGSRVGVVGWKTYADRGSMDVPSYIVDELRRVTGEGGTVENATDLLIDAADGLRVINEVDQLAALEARGLPDLEWGAPAAARPPAGDDRARGGPAPRLGRRAAVLPSHAHGRPARDPRAAESRAIEPSSAATASPSPSGSGVRSSAGPGSWSPTPSELPAGIADYVDRLVAPYFEAVAEWYGALRIGQTGGALFEIVDRHLGDPFFGIFLNPGHQIQLDEWVNSPISRGSTIELRSGMAFQVDIIPATGTDYFTTNIEDGVALADASLRAAFEAAHPAAWARIQARRAFMADALGIELHPDVLPFSNLPAYLPPFLLRPDHAMTMLPAD